MKIRLAVVLVVSAFCTTGGEIGADEGMWLLNKLPEKHLKQKYGFSPTAGWVEHIQESCIRFGRGGSASFVSSDGLIMTNHHVGSDAIQNLSKMGRDYMRDGFYARTSTEELKSPDTEIKVLMAVEEVTDRIKAASAPDMDPAEAMAARKKVMAAIETEARDRTGLQPEVVSLFRGARYDLYLYKRYTDVRLVMAPEFEIAFFGGDLDNFEYPRYDLDVCFFRAYENGKPAKVKHYLKWSASGPKEGELIFVAGHPARTQRSYTLDHLRFLRDMEIPLLLACYNQREVALLQFTAESDEHRRIGLDDLFYIQNGRKAYGGILAGLLDARLMQRKVKQEEALRAFVAADPARHKAHGSAWEDLRRSLTEARSYYVAYYMMENRRTKLCRLYDIARKLVRAAEERKKPDGERLEEYRDAKLPSLESALFSTAPIYDELEQLRLEDGLIRLGRVLGGDHPIVQTALGGSDARRRAAELLAGTRLKDVGTRKKLYEGGTGAIAGSDDAMIRFALALDPPARALRERYEKTLKSVEEAAYARIADARFAMQGDSVYPDATFTLRLAIGTVSGYEEVGRRISAMTTMRGAFELSALHGNQPPYRLPKRWLESHDKLDLDTPFDFVSTNDIIGGNSGSPMFNRNGEVTGLVFDGNIHGLVWDFIFDQEQARAVSVHSQAIIEALRKVYDAGPLVAELLGEG